MSLRFALIKISQASILLPVIVGLQNYKKLNIQFKILFFFFASTIGFEIQASILKMVYHNNMPGLHLFTLLEFLVFSSVYYLNFPKNTLLKLLIVINGIVFIVIAFTDALLINTIWNPNTLSRSYSSISIITYTLIYFYYLFSNDLEYYSWQYPMFWISISALIYFGINMFYFMLNRYLISKAANTAILSLYTHAVINCISNLLYAQSFRCFRKQKALL